MSWAADTVGAPQAGSWDGGQLLGIGVKGSEIPATGESGPSYLYEHATLPADNDVEFRGEWISVPSGPGITFDADEYGRITLIAPNGSYIATYNLYRDGVLDGGSPYQIDFDIGTVPANVDLSPMLYTFEQQAAITAANLKDLDPMVFTFTETASVAAGQVVIMSPMAFTFEQQASTTLSNTQALAPMAFVFDQAAALTYGNTIDLAPNEFIFGQNAGIGAGGLVDLSPMAFTYDQASSVTISASVDLSPMVLIYGQASDVIASVNVDLSPMAFIFRMSASVRRVASPLRQASISFVKPRTYGRMI